MNGVVGAGIVCMCFFFFVFLMRREKNYGVELKLDCRIELMNDVYHDSSTPSIFSLKKIHLIPSDPAKRTCTYTFKKYINTITPV